MRVTERSASVSAIASTVPSGGRRVTRAACSVCVEVTDDAMDPGGSRAGAGVRGGGARAGRELAGGAMPGTPRKVAGVDLSKGQAWVYVDQTYLSGTKALRAPGRGGLKAARRLEDIHFVILRSFLKAAGREHGLLLNFAGASLEIKRVFSRTTAAFSPMPPVNTSASSPPSTAI